MIEYKHDVSNVTSVNIRVTYEQPTNPSCVG